MVKKLIAEPLGPLHGVRVLQSADAIALGELMHEGYFGTMDYDDETVAQSIEEVKATLAGKYGTLLPTASYVAMDKGKMISAAVFVFFEKNKMPLLAFTMTHPDYKGKRWSQHLVKLGLQALKTQGYDECCLYVTEGNQPAQSIYEKLGFKKLP